MIAIASKHDSNALYPSVHHVRVHFVYLPSSAIDALSTNQPTFFSFRDARLLLHFWNAPPLCLALHPPPFLGGVLYLSVTQGDAIGVVVSDTLIDMYDGEGTHALQLQRSHIKSVGSIYTDRTIIIIKKLNSTVPFSTDLSP